MHFNRIVVDIACVHVVASVKVACMNVRSYVDIAANMDVVVQIEAAMAIEIEQANGDQEPIKHTDSQ